MKIGLGIVVASIVLAVLNSIALNNETQDAELTVEGAELVETSVGTLQVLDEGPRSGPAIVLVHCFTCSMRWFDRIAPLLTERNRVVRVDLLGHGGSEKPKGVYSIPDQATGVIEAASELGVEDATVVGHSLGGGVAVEMAAQSPDLAARVMTVGSKPTPDTGSLTFTARLGVTPVIGPALSRFADVAPASFLRGQLGQAFEDGFSTAQGFDNPDQPVDDYLAMTYPAYDGSHHGFDDYVERNDLPSRLGASGVPAVVVFGSEDQIIPSEEEAVATFATAESAETVVLEETGHSPNVEDPELLAPLILDLVSEGLQEARAEARREAKRKREAERKRRQAQKRKRVRGQRGGKKG